MDLAYIRGWFRRYWLAVWFGSISAIAVAPPILRGSVSLFDADLYLNATRAWLEGGNPWDVARDGFFFAAPPPTLLPLVPFALLPHAIGVVVLAALVLAANVASIRMLRLPMWWLLFPPVVQCTMSANVQAFLIPLIIAGGGWLAVMLKSYAVVPLLVLGKWRQLVIAAVVTLVTFPVLPWGIFIEDFSRISANLADQSNYGLPTPLLVALAPIGLISLAGIGRERAAWLAVPALWPSPQLYYATLALPSKSWLAAAIIAFPIQGSGLLAVIGLAIATVLARRREREAGNAGASARPETGRPAGDGGLDSVV